MRIFLVLGLLALCAAAVPVLRPDWLPPLAQHDGQPNRYRVEIDDAGGRVHVTASIWLDAPMLSMFDVSPSAALPLGHASLVRDLEVRAADGDRLRPRDLGLGDYALRAGQRVSLDYHVVLEHDRHDWPAGKEEVAYRGPEGWLFRGSTLLFADGGERMVGPFEVEFVLPPGWQAHTPWPAADRPNAFRPASRRELLNNVLFVGTSAAERIEAGGLELTLVLEPRYRARLPLFRDLLATQARSYAELFGGAPLARRYLVVIGEGASGDGGAFAGSFSQLIPGDATPENRVVWGHTMAHELLHFWNGLSLVPADFHEEWFKEGVTDYLTVATMARNGLVDRDLVLRRLENAQRRWVLARHLQGSTLGVREAGRDKQPNRLLVYGGGALAALALDAELRLRSGDRVGLDALAAALFAEFGRPDARYALADIERHCRALTGSDFGPFLATALDGRAGVDSRTALAAFGLRMDSFAEEIYIAPDPAAPATARARFAAVFGATDAAVADR